jgi:hypothetical protein
MFGPIINKFLYGTDATIPNIDRTKFPAAYNMAARAISTKVPSGILPLADAIWTKQHPNKLYGGSWKCPLPSTYAEQEFSRMTCFANGSYGLDAIQQMNGSPLPERTRRVCTTNNSGTTQHLRPINNFEEHLIDVSHSPPTNGGQTLLSPDSLVGR